MYQKYRNLAAGAIIGCDTYARMALDAIQRAEDDSIGYAEYNMSQLEKAIGYLKKGKQDQQKAIDFLLKAKEEMKQKHNQAVRDYLEDGGNF